MRGEFIHQIYIADGFDDDCDALIQRCVQTEKLNYQAFCEIWKDMKFDSLYIGRTSAAELAELSEELIHVAKQYMVAIGKNFEETVAALFLVYGLLNLQPYAGFAVLRLVPSDVPAVKRIEMIARRDKRRDVLYILGAVLVKHTQYHSEQRERGLESVYRKYLNGYIGIDTSGFRPRGAFYRQTEELDALRELASLTDRYQNAKKAITGGKIDQSLSFINAKLPSELDSSLKRLISGIPGMNDEDEIDEADVHYSKVQLIKEKAMKKAVGGMKHLTSAAERKSEKPISKAALKIKDKTEKLKFCSLAKPMSSPNKSPRLATNNKTSPKTKQAAKLPESLKTKPPLKRKLRSYKRRAKKAKIDSESSSDSDIDVNKLTQDDDDDYSGEELDLDEFDKPSEETNEQVGKDKLPSRITTVGDGKVYEIEVVDDLDKSKEDLENSDESNVEIEGMNDAIPSSSKSPVFKKPNYGARRTKPTKSLNRMGIMPANEITKDFYKRQLRSHSKQ